MSRINTSKVSNVPQDPDNVYLDLIITNLKSSGTPPIPINFNENRNNPVIIQYLIPKNPILTKYQTIN